MIKLVLRVTVFAKDFSGKNNKFCSIVVIKIFLILQNNIVGLVL